MGRQHKQYGPKNLAKVVNDLHSPRVQRYLVQRGVFRAYLTTPSLAVIEGFERRGYTVEAVMETDGKQ